MSSPDENDLPTLHSLHEPADLAEPRPDLYIRWSRGPAADKHGTSKDELTGVELPGLCAYPLASEDGGRIARFAHGSLGACSTTATSKSAAGMAFARGCWRARKLGRGPDNEPIVRCDEPVAWIDDAVVREAEIEMTAKNEDWGPLDRGSGSGKQVPAAD